jgi:hypothetical protein
MATALPRRLARNEIAGAEIYNRLRDYVEASTPLPSAEINVNRQAAGTTLSLNRKGHRDARQIWWGKPVSAFASGATVEIDPCDVTGVAIDLPNVTAYVQASKASYTMYTGTTLATSTICAFTRGNDGFYYLLGAPKRVLVGTEWSTGTGFSVYIKDDWGLFWGTTSNAVSVFGVTTQDVYTDVIYSTGTGAMTASRKTLRVFNSDEQTDDTILTAVETRVVTDVDYSEGSGALTHTYRTQRVFPDLDDETSEAITTAEDCDDAQPSIYGAFGGY